MAFVFHLPCERVCTGTSIHDKYERTEWAGRDQREVRKQPAGELEQESESLSTMAGSGLAVHPSPLETGLL